MGCGSSRGGHAREKDESPEIPAPDEIGVISENAINLSEPEDMGLCASQPRTPRGNNPQTGITRQPSPKTAHAAPSVPFARPAEPGERGIEAVKIIYHMTAEGVVQTIHAAPLPARATSPQAPQIPTIFAAVPDLRGHHDNLEIGGAVPLSFFRSAFNTQPWVLKNAAARRNLGLEN